MPPIDEDPPLPVQADAENKLSPKTNIIRYFFNIFCM
jgi:hypothetical protein